ncbi:hypothetical protein IWX49DRAFT_578221 [Phyllosticta citricarpa]|uniref:Uncharacterized protein n=2 Tax=Phyllosticta TaxID=121621 RepID=A0ABR1N769_9PEZI
MADRSEENLATFLQRLNFDLNLSPSTKPSKPQLKPVTSSQTPKANSGASRKSSKASPVKPRYQSPNRLSARANSFVPSASVQETPASADPFQEKSPVDPPKQKTAVDPRYESLDKQGKILLSILKSPPGTVHSFKVIQNGSPSKAGPTLRRDSTSSPCSACPYDSATCPCPIRYPPQVDIEEFAVESDLASSRHGTPEFEAPGSIDTLRSESKSPNYNLPISAIAQTLRSSSIGATMAPALGGLFGLGNSRFAPKRPSTLYNPFQPVNAERFPQAPPTNEENVQQQSAMQADLQLQAQIKREAEEAEYAQLKKEQEDYERERLAKFKATKEEAERREREKRMEAAKRAAQLQKEQEEREHQRLLRIQMMRDELERREHDRQLLAKLKLEQEEAELREQLRREEESKRAAQLKREHEERERQRLAKIQAVKEEAARLEREKAKRAAQLKKEEEEREHQRLAKFQAEKEETELKERERQLLLKVQRVDAIAQIQAYAKDGDKKYEILVKQADDKIDQQTSDLDSFNTSIDAKEIEYAQLKHQLKTLGEELSSMTATKMGMDKDLRQLEESKSELVAKAQTLQDEASEKTEMLKNEFLSSEDVATILEFIKPELEIQAPEVELSRLSLSDKVEDSDDDEESSGDEDSFVDLGATRIPAWWKLNDTGIEADRVVKLVNLPTNITEVEIQALVWGGPLDRIVYKRGDSTAEVYFLIGQDCGKYYKATANHILYPGDEKRLIRVEKCPPSPRHPFLRYAWENQVTRCVLATGVPDGWTKGELKKFAASHGREVEQVLFGKTKSGVRLAEFRFLNITNANAFKFLLKRDIDFYKVKTTYAADQCAVKRGVHTEPR